MFALLAALVLFLAAFHVHLGDVSMVELAAALVVLHFAVPVGVPFPVPSLPPRRQPPG